MGSDKAGKYVRTCYQDKIVLEYSSLNIGVCICSLLACYDEFAVVSQVQFLLENLVVSWQ